MQKASLLLLVVAAAGSLGPTPGSRLLRPRRDGRIINGYHILIEDAPWHLSFRYDGSNICSASVINSGWALTAARCVYKRYLSRMSVRAGASYVEFGGTVYGVDRALYHSNYRVKDYWHDYDVAVVKISGSFSFGSTVQPVRLATEYPPIGTQAHIMGFGYKNRGVRYTFLFRTASVIVGRRYCQKCWLNLNTLITENMMCTNNTPGDFCHGDYGGPLMVGNTQYGIASWHIDCGNPVYPSVYTSVVALHKWITWNSRDE